jgi:hypothetical protein
MRRGCLDHLLPGSPRLDPRRACRWIHSDPGHPAGTDQHSAFHRAGQSVAAGLHSHLRIVHGGVRDGSADVVLVYRPPSTPPARPDNEPWTPPPAIDAVSGQPARLAEDGVVAILGLNRLAAAEDAVRAAQPGGQVTAVLVTGDPSELAPLARLVVAELCGCLRQAFPPSAWPRLQVVHDESGMLAAAAGVTEVSDGIEAAVRIEAGRIVARADGFGACHAAAVVDLSAPSANLH